MEPAGTGSDGCTQTPNSPTFNFFWMSALKELRNCFRSSFFFRSSAILSVSITIFLHSTMGAEVFMWCLCCAGEGGRGETEGE